MVAEIHEDESIVDVTKDTVPIRTTQEPVEPQRFTPKQERKIEMMRESWVRAQRELETTPSDVEDEDEEDTQPDTVEPQFEGSYNKRYHWMDVVTFWGQLFFTVLAWVGLFLVGAWLKNFLIYGASEFAMGNPEYLQGIALKSGEWINLWIPLAISLAVTALTVWRSGKMMIIWYFGRFIVTKTRIIKQLVVPTFLQFLFSIDDSEIYLPRSIVKSVEIDQSWLGKLFDYGTVTFETNLQSDERFHDIDFVSRVSRIRKMFPANEHDALS